MRSGVGELAEHLSEGRTVQSFWAHEDVERAARQIAPGVRRARSNGKHSRTPTLRTVNARSAVLTPCCGPRSFATANAAR
jgi:hypothetical protein